MASSTKDSFIFRNEEKIDEKTQIAKAVTSEFISGNEWLFIGTGTTCARIADLAMQTFRDITIGTNSVPILWNAMILKDKGELQDRVRIEAVGKSLDQDTGILKDDERKLKTYGAEKVILAPHGIDHAYLTGNRDVEELRALTESFREVIIVATFGKIGRAGSHKIKSLGHLAGKRSNRSVSLVTPVRFSETESVGRRAEIRETLKGIRDKGIKTYPETIDD